MTVAALNYSDLNGYDLRHDWIARSESNFGQVIDIFNGSATAWAPAVNAALHEIEVDCREDGWDGEGSVAIAAETIHLAHQVASHLFTLVPIGTPGPEVVPEGDGDIDLSWYRSEQRMFSLSIRGRGVINYAGRLGRKGEVHGWLPVEASDSGSLRDTLVEVSNHIKKLYDEDSVARRS